MYLALISWRCPGIPECNDSYIMTHTCRGIYLTNSECDLCGCGPGSNILLFENVYRLRIWYYSNGQFTGLSHRMGYNSVILLAAFEDFIVSAITVRGILPTKLQSDADHMGHVLDQVRLGRLLVDTYHIPDSSIVLVPSTGRDLRDLLLNTHPLAFTHAHIVDAHRSYAYEVISCLFAHDCQPLLSLFLI